jgi:Calcineurin-like phosphoesterase
MEAQITGASGPAPSFFFHLGDVVYYDGQSGFYGPQFYSPYQYYPREIVAIPGNHDGDTRFQPPDPPPDGPTLAGFMKNFCDKQRESIYPYRQTMTQPYCWWVLDAPFATIIGMYSNIEGTLDPRGGSEQQQFLQTQIAAAPSDRFLVLAVHHPPYSLDAFHGGTLDIATAIDMAIQKTGRAPDLVLSGHVHAYQRFTRTLPMPGAKGKKPQTTTLPYVVAGAGGFANNAASLHKIETNPANGKPPANGTKCKSQVDPSLMLSIDGQNDHDASFLRVTVTAAQLTVEAFAVPFSGTPPASPFDSVQVNLHS